MFLPSPHLCSRSSTVVDGLFIASLTDWGIDVISESQSVEVLEGIWDLRTFLQFDERPRWIFSPLRPLKYFLEGSTLFQREIEKFISKCKSLENEAGYLSNDLYELNANSKYKFSSGPFAEKIFKIMQLQKNKIDILIGDFKATISKEKYSFYPT